MFALLCLAWMPLLAQETQEAPMAPEPADRLIFEAGLVGGNSVACPGPSDWLVRPALRAGIEYDGGDTSPTAGLSLTFGRRYGARFMAHHGEVSGGKDIHLFQMGVYFSFGGRR